MFKVYTFDVIFSFDVWSIDRSIDSIRFDRYHYYKWWLSNGKIIQCTSLCVCVYVRKWILIERWMNEWLWSLSNSQFEWEKNKIKNWSFYMLNTLYINVDEIRKHRMYFVWLLCPLKKNGHEHHWLSFSIVRSV